MNGTSSVASPSSMPLLTISVAVVKKILDAVAGSAPNRFSISGTIAPEMPLMVHAPTIAVQKLEAITAVAQRPQVLKLESIVVTASRKGAPL